MNDCDKVRYHYIHKRVKCCAECHEFMLPDEEGDTWDGYDLKLPSGEEVGICHTVFEAVPDTITLAD